MTDHYFLAIELLNKYSNLIILRTFSKWAGLAGLRIGYMLANTNIIQRIMQIKQPYNINVSANESAIVSLQQRNNIINTAVKAMLYERYRLMYQLNTLQWIKPLPSQANFILCELSNNALKQFNSSPRTLQKLLFNKGILVRCYAGNSDSTLNNHIRISCGRPIDTDRLMNELYNITEQYKLNTQLNINQLRKQLVVNNQNNNNNVISILFDMDGVLADVSQSYRQAIIQTCAHYNIHINDNDITSIKNKGDANNDWLVTYNILQHNNVNVTYEQVKSTFQDLYLGSINKPGLRDTESLLIDIELIQLLSSKCKLGIVTGRPKQECLWFLTKYNIKQYFSAITCMEDGPAKPNSFSVVNTLKLLNINSNTTGTVYMIGDTIDDINAVNNTNNEFSSNTLNMIPLGICPPTNNNKTMYNTVSILYQAGASRVLNNLNELYDIVLNKPYNIYNSNVIDSNNTTATTSATTTTQQQLQQQLQQRIGRCERVTNETQCVAEVNLDGTGKSNIHTGIGFLDHMLTALSKHSRIDMNISCIGDLHIDDHHTTEDTGITIGQAILHALGNKQGIIRYGYSYAPLDESLSRAIVDISGRSSQHINLLLKRDNISDISTEMLVHFIKSLGDAAKLTLHIDVLRGDNDHHKAESAFKALALALKQAVSIDLKNRNDMPSTKGAL